MTTPTSKGGEKAATTKRRKRDSHIKTEPAQEAANNFADALSTDAGKGAVTRAAQKAYPKQSKRAAAVTGSRLLKNPNVQAMIAERRRRAMADSDISRQEVIGLLAQQARASLADVTNDDGTALDMKQARERGLDHLLREITVTERSHTRRVRLAKGKYRTEVHRRVTTKYKIHDPQKAIDLLSEIAGWKREPAKNPIDLARANFQVMRGKDIYRDIPDAKLAEYPAAQYNVSVAEILEGQP